MGCGTGVERRWAALKKSYPEKILQRGCKKASLNWMSHLWQLQQRSRNINSREFANEDDIDTPSIWTTYPPLNKTNKPRPFHINIILTLRYVFFLNNYHSVVPISHKGILLVSSFKNIRSDSIRRNLGIIGCFFFL